MKESGSRADSASTGWGEGEGAKGQDGMFSGRVSNEAERREEGEEEGGRSEERSGGLISQSETGWYHSSCTAVLSVLKWS